MNYQKHLLNLNQYLPYIYSFFVLLLDWDAYLHLHQKQNQLILNLQQIQSPNSTIQQSQKYLLDLRLTILHMEHYQQSINHNFFFIIEQIWGFYTPELPTLCLICSTYSVFPIIEHFCIYSLTYEQPSQNYLQNRLPVQYCHIYQIQTQFSQSPSPISSQPHNTLQQNWGTHEKNDYCPYPNIPSNSVQSGTYDIKKPCTCFQYLY